MHNKIIYYWSQLKEWFKHPTQSFTLSKNFKVSFNKLHDLFAREEYEINVIEVGKSKTLTASVVNKGDIRFTYIDLMKVFM